MAKRKKLTLSKLKNKAQSLFNKHIRERDSDGEYFTCISCGKTLSKEHMNAGHYFPVKGYDHLRYDLDNVHGECRGCNAFNDAHLIHYTWNLIDKIGKKRYNALLKKSKNKTKLTYLEVENIIDLYKQK